jgi:hypothetical protein
MRPNALVSKAVGGMVLVVGLPFWLGAIPVEPPQPLPLTEKERATLSSRKAVVRFEGDDQGGYAVGVINVVAPAAVVWRALFDFKARVAEIGALRAVDVYDADLSDRDMAVRFELKVFGVGVDFHVRYALDEERGWCTYSLDAQRDNDLPMVAGAYQVYEHQGGSQLVYRSQSDSGRKVPGFVKNWLLTGSLTEQLEGVRNRSETNAP